MNLPENCNIDFSRAKVVRINTAALGLPAPAGPAKFVEPIVRTDRPAPPDPLAPPERDVLKSLVAVAGRFGVSLWRNNVGSFPVHPEGGRRRYFRSGLCPGSADLIGLLPGRGTFLAVEAKRPGARPRPDQVAWLQMVNAHGGIGIWCDRVEQLERALDLLIGPGGYMLGVRMEDGGDWSIVERGEVGRL